MLIVAGIKDGKQGVFIDNKLHRKTDGLVHTILKHNDQIFTANNFIETLDGETLNYSPYPLSVFYWNGNLHFGESAELFHVHNYDTNKPVLSVDIYHKYSTGIVKKVAELNKDELKLSIWNHCFTILDKDGNLNNEETKKKV